MIYKLFQCGGLYMDYSDRCVFKEGNEKSEEDLDNVIL